MTTEIERQTNSHCDHVLDTQLSDKFISHGVEPLWNVMQAMVPKSPQPRAEVAIWRYKDLRPLLIEAGKTVSAEEAERRVLMLKNPALRKSHREYSDIGSDVLNV